METYLQKRAHKTQTSPNGHSNPPSPLNGTRWVPVQPELARRLDEALEFKYELTWKTQHKMKGMIGYTVKSTKANYSVDWSTFSQVNMKTKKKRPLRRKHYGVVTHDHQPESVAAQDPNPSTNGAQSADETRSER